MVDDWGNEGLVGLAISDPNFFILNKLKPPGLQVSIK